MDKRSLTGHITLVQEERFRLATTDGRSFLFTLDRKSSVQPSVVRDLKRSGTTVKVEYSGEPNTRTGIAHGVRSTD